MPLRGRPRSDGHWKCLKEAAALVCTCSGSYGAAASSTPWAMQEYITHHLNGYGLRLKLKLHHETYDLAGSLSTYTLKEGFIYYC